MLTAKDKALELYNYYSELIKDFTRGVSIHELAKLCALKTVDEIINTHLLSEKDIFGIHPVDYWIEVKREIEAL